METWVPCMWDSGATNNGAPEELLVFSINKALSLGVRPGDERWPVVRLWTVKNEEIAGIRKGAGVQIVAVAVMKLTFSPSLDRKSGTTKLVEFLVFGWGQSDYPGILIGLPTLDVKRGPCWNWVHPSPVLGGLSPAQLQ